MRFLPHSDTDRKAMLDALGIEHIRQLFDDIPKSLHLKEGSLNLPEARHEAGIVRDFQQAANSNRHAENSRCFLGAGTYHHFIPATVDAIISRGEFLTAYTPYQPEIAQGTLQTLFEYQTMVARLTGMEVSNASMYDAATAVAEAALMARRITRRQNIVLASSMNHRYRAVTENYLQRLGHKPKTISSSKNFQLDLTALIESIDQDTACVIVQYPDAFGSLADLAPLRQACDAHKALLVIAFADATAFALVQSPGDFDADIAVGSGQALGIPMSYGGPHLGLFACKKKYVRQMPGRLCGMSTDADGKRSFVLTLSTREQHIRREKATSNICSNQGLMCTAAAVYMATMGEDGLQTVANNSHAALHQLIKQLPDHVQAANGAHYHETILSFVDQKARQQFLAHALEQHIFAGIALEKLDPDAEPRHLLVCTTEMIEQEDIDAYINVLEAAK